MKKVLSAAKHHHHNFRSRRLRVWLLSACALMATACQNDEEEVRPDAESGKVAQASRDLAALKPVTVHIKSDNQADKDGN